MIVKCIDFIRARLATTIKICLALLVLLVLHTLLYSALFYAIEM